MSEALYDYLFDLQGYFIIEQAVDDSLVDDVNAALDAIPSLPPSGWWGNVQRTGTSQPEKGVEYQNVVEAGEPFERLIDHPSWIDLMHRYCGESGNYWQGLFIDECFASIRKEGAYQRVHSGGYRAAIRQQYNYEDGVFRCGQVNVLVALSDIGPGDGGTLVIPGSHKSRFPHPEVGDYQAGRMDDLTGVVQPELHRGDVLVFIDSITHGSATRTATTGERRTVIYRYGPRWGATRFGYEYSEELLARLTPARRAILQPVAPRRPEA